MKTYSSAGLARMLDVNESTVKRWADGGSIDCVKTPGGHRRFPVAAVMKFIQQNKLAVPELAHAMEINPDLRAHVLAGNIKKLAPELKSAAMAGDESTALNILRSAMAAKPDLLAIFEEVVFPPLREIGAEWEVGTITVDEEHLASQTIRTALTRLQPEIHDESQHGRLAVFGCFEEELHDIGLLCASIYLASRGWKTHFLGQMTPTRSLLNAIRKQRPHLVVISTVAGEAPRRFVRAVNEVLYPQLRRTGGRLVVGGPRLHARFGNKLKSDLLAHSLSDLRNLAVPAVKGRRKEGRS